MLATVVVVYARTLEPVKVIDDPALMLSFIGAVVAITLLVRRAAHPTHASTRLGRLWSQRLGHCVHAKPRGVHPKPRPAAGSPAVDDLSFTTP